MAGLNDSTALIMDIDHFAVHDGPGIRTSVYFKGCPLSCAWCHSPESQSPFREILYTASRCVLCGLCAEKCPKKLHRVDGQGHAFSRSECDLCGLCVEKCPKGALSFSGKEMAFDEVLKETLADRVFYRNSGGGATLSGGEVLAQGPFVIRLLHELRRNEVHTIVETSGFGSEDYLLAFADADPLFYFDFKIADTLGFQRYIGPNPDPVWRNLEKLRRKTAKIALRFPLIPTITDTPENVAALYKTAKELKIPSVHLLPYNYSAGAKYDWVGKPYLLDFLKDIKQTPEDLLKLDHSGVDVEISR